MKEFLELQMWFNISNKIKCSVIDAKRIINDLYDRFEKDVYFDLSNCDETIKDAFEFYLDSKRYLE